MPPNRDRSGNGDLTRLTPAHPGPPNHHASDRPHRDVHHDARPTGDLAEQPEQLLVLTVTHPIAGMCVATVAGELDALTTPELQACLTDQLATAPPHLIVDLQPVRFLSAAGLSCLMHARELAHTTRSQLHLAGLVAHPVARLVRITGLLGLFDTHPAALTRVAMIIISESSAEATRPVSTGRLTTACCPSPACHNDTAQRADIYRISVHTKVIAVVSISLARLLPSALLLYRACVESTGAVGSCAGISRFQVTVGLPKGRPEDSDRHRAILAAAGEPPGWHTKLTSHAAHV